MAGQMEKEEEDAAAVASLLAAAGSKPSGEPKGIKGPAWGEVKFPQWKDRKDYLRPEVVESLFYLYRATGDQVGGAHKGLGPGLALGSGLKGMGPGKPSMANGLQTSPELTSVRSLANMATSAHMGCTPTRRSTGSGAGKSSGPLRCTAGCGPTATALCRSACHGRGGCVMCSNAGQVCGTHAYLNYLPI